MWVLYFGQTLWTALSSQIPNTRRKFVLIILDLFKHAARILQKLAFAPQSISAALDQVLDMIQ